jgi:hypothetical protein
MNNVSDDQFDPPRYACRGCDAMENQLVCGDEQFLRLGQELILCGMCGLAYLSPDFTDAALTRFYQRDYRRLSLVDAARDYNETVFTKLLSREFAQTRAEAVAPLLPQGVLQQ